jgi:hypothetical protein
MSRYKLERRHVRPVRATSQQIDCICVVSPWRSLRCSSNFQKKVVGEMSYRLPRTLREILGGQSSYLPTPRSSSVIQNLKTDFRIETEVVLGLGIDIRQEISCT